MAGHNLSAEQLDEIFLSVENPTAYYLKRAELGERYGMLALQVVGDEPISGAVARALAASVCRERGVVLDADR